MAKDSNDLNLAKDTVATDAEPKSGGLKKILLLTVVLLVVAAGGAAGAYFFLGGEEPAAVATDAEGEPVAEEEIDEGEAIYLSLDPAFVVNFEYQGGIRYLQVSLQIMAYDQEVIDKVDNNLPAVRNTLIMLFSTQDFDELRSVAGKEKLRQEALVAVNSAVRLPDQKQVKDVFFTGFVQQ